MSIEKFALESERKEKLMDLLVALSAKNGFMPRSRIFNGIAIVGKVGPRSIFMKREDGRPIGFFPITCEIAALIRPGEHLMGTWIRVTGQWHLQEICMIGTPLDGQLHISTNGHWVRENELQ